MHFSGIFRVCYVSVLMTGWGLVFSGCQGHAKHETANASAPSDAGKADEFHRRGVEFLRQGKLVEAQRAFEQAIEVDRGFGPAHNNLGKIYLRQKHLYQAAWEFENACKLLPTRPEPENNLAMVYEQAGRLEQAVTHYTKALSLGPDNAEILGNLVRARIRRGDRDESLKEQLSQLVSKDTRPEWLAWAKEKLATIASKQADPSPRDILPKPEPSNILVPFNPENAP